MKRLVVIRNPIAVYVWASIWGTIIEIPETVKEMFFGPTYPSSGYKPETLSFPTETAARRLAKTVSEMEQSLLVVIRRQGSWRRKFTWLPYEVVTSGFANSLVGYKQIAYYQNGREVEREKIH